MRSKYGARRTDGFASRKEKQVYQDLLMQQKLGLILDLRTQVRYELTPKMGKEKSSAYVADFVYFENGKEVVADAKGFRTPLYVLKRKMMLYRYGISIKEL